MCVLTLVIYRKPTLFCEVYNFAKFRFTKLYMREINDIILSAESVDLIDMGISDESTIDTNAVHLVENLTSSENTVGDNECKNVEEV